MNKWGQLDGMINPQFCGMICIINTPPIRSNEGINITLGAEACCLNMIITHYGSNKAWSYRGRKWEKPVDVSQAEAQFLIKTIVIMDFLLLCWSLIHPRWDLLFLVFFFVHDDCLIQLELRIVAVQYFGLLIYFAIHEQFDSKSSNSENETIPEDNVIARRLLSQSSGDLMGFSDMFNINFESDISTNMKPV